MKNLRSKERGKTRDIAFFSKKFPFNIKITQFFEVKNVRHPKPLGGLDVHMVNILKSTCTHHARF
jgi:hypothetical protein